MSTNLFTFGSDRINFINENNCREFFSASSNTFLKLLSLSPAILLMILGPMIKKKKALVSFATARTMSICLTGTWWTKQEDTARRLDTD